MLSLKRLDTVPVLGSHSKALAPTINPDMPTVLLGRRVFRNLRTLENFAKDGTTYIGESNVCFKLFIGQMIGNRCL